MEATPAPKNTVHWAPSPVPSPLSDSCSFASTSSISSTSTLQYINAQLISHGFAVSPGLCLDGLSSADAEGVTKCLLSMLGQRVVSAAVVTFFFSCIFIFNLFISHAGGHDARRGADDEAPYALV